MSRFSLWIIQPPGWSHMRLFREVGDALAASLRALGHEVAYAPGDAPLLQAPPRFPDGGYGRSLVIGAHFLPDVPLAEDAILLNFEQVPERLGSGPGTVDAQLSDMWLRSAMLQLYRRHTVWEYSVTNAERLRRLGCERVRQVRVGYSPILERIPAAPEDIDVLFIGTLQPGTRRAAVLGALQEAGVRVNALSGVYGAERDALIARAKILLNVHNNPPEIAPAIFEIVRCSYYWANRKCVVTEGAGQDPELEALAERACVLAPLEQIVDACRVLLANTSIREDVARHGYEEFKKIDLTEDVRRALEVS